LRRYHLAGGRHEDVEKAAWDIGYSYFSHGGRYRVTGVNNVARPSSPCWTPKPARRCRFPSYQRVTLLRVNISRDEKQMAFYLNVDRAPSNLYVYNFSTGQASKLTDTLSKEIDPLDLVESEVVRFKSFDGLTVPSIYYKPHQASSSRRPRWYGFTEDPADRRGRATAPLFSIW
jgi:hypothetical protein